MTDHDPRIQTQRERLAALAHEQWAGWMRYMFSRCKIERNDSGSVRLVRIPSEWYERWQRQVETAYADLSEDEKESDRQEADRVIALLATVAAVTRESVERAEGRIDLEQEIDHLCKELNARDEEVDRLAVVFKEQAAQITALQAEVEGLRQIEDRGL